jgi:hypothetical protein
MKRTFLAMIMLGSTCALFAQNTQTGTTTNTSTNTNTSINSNTNTNNNQWNTTTNSNLNTTNTMTSTGTYSAYGTATSVNVPSNVQYTFQTNYPMAGSNVTWQQVSPEWWRASYGTPGQYTNVMYNQAGQSFLVAVPVMQTYVPQEVVDKAYQMHGITLYDIHAMRGSNGQDWYTVRYLDNGTIQTEKINADGTAYMDMNMNTMNSSSTNAAMDNSTNATNTTTTTDNTTTTDMNVDQSANGGKTKVKVKNANGEGTKTKYKNGELRKQKTYKGNGSGSEM